MLAHSDRLLLSITHEVLNAIRNQQPVWSTDADFRTAVSLCTATTKRDWQALTEASQARGRDEPLHQFLLKVRNNLGFHYGQPKILIRGYHAHFNSSSDLEIRRGAYASIGNNLAKSRFFFADAAAEAGVNEVLARGIPNRHEIFRKYILAITGVLAGVVQSFIELRKRSKRNRRS